MNQALGSIGTASQHLKTNTAELVVAVGMDGKAVVLRVLRGNRDLLRDVASMEAAMALWPSPLPTLPGLYLFSGHSRIETFGNTNDDSLKEVFHRCTYREINRADLTMLLAKMDSH